MNSLIDFVPRKVAMDEIESQAEQITKVLREYFPDITDANFAQYRDRLKLEPEENPASLILDDNVTIAEWGEDGFQGETNLSPAVYFSGFKPIHRKELKYYLRAKDDIKANDAISFKKGDLFYPSGKQDDKPYLTKAEFDKAKRDGYVHIDTGRGIAYSYQLRRFDIDYK